MTNKQLKALEDAIAAVTKSQADFATVTQLKESAQALSQQQAGALTAADLKGIQKAVASLEKSRNGFATTAQLQKLEVVTDEIKSLQSEISALAKTQDEFAILSASLKDVESKIAALADGKKKTGLLSKLSKKTDTKVTNKQLVELENAVATLEKTQTKFASLASSQISTLESTLDAISQQQSSALTAADLKSIQKAVAALEKSQESFATTAQLQKVDASREMKALEEALAEILQSQHSFANSTAVDELETKVMALEARYNEKRGGMFKRSASADTSVTNKQLKALEDAIAAVTKSQADFATVTQLKESAQALSQQQAGALTAADLKGIQKAVASLEKSRNGFATTAQLQKLEVVTDEIKSLQSEISALAKTQDEFAILSASLKDVESKIAALADGKKKTGLLSKLSKKTDTKVTNKQLKALEDAIAAVTKSQADFATVTQLKKVAAALDALKNVRDNYATTKLVKNLEDKLNQLIKTSGSVSTTPQTNLVELEQRAMERVESYIKTIPKDTSRKLTKHIEEASSLWFADRTGRQDFALASGGGRVVGHSQLSPFVGRGDGPITSMLSFLRSGVHPKSDEWLLTPSLEQPGDCIALHSSTGYVDVRLRQSVKVDAVTLEHANSLNAYDLHSAPRDVQVYGWHAREKNCKHSKPPKSLIPLGNYTYSINRGSVQIFDVVSPQTVDHVRLVVKNNQGHQKWTCLYRFRVHGVPERVEA